MKKTGLILLFILLKVLVNSQDYKILQFTLNPDDILLNQPVSIDLSGVDYYKDSTYIQLYRIDGKNKIPVASQLEQDYHDRLWFVPDSSIKRGEKIIFEIHRIPGEKLSNGVIVKKDNENIRILSDGKEILSYRYALIEAPSGIDPLYRRYGGYIHPLKSPSGKMLTCIQPSDHYHHYGIWNPWTLTYFEGREVDFWNLARGIGNCKICRHNIHLVGELFGGFKVKHDHIDFSAPGEDKTAINEMWDVRAWNVKPGRTSRSGSSTLYLH